MFTLNKIKRVKGRSTKAISVFHNTIVSLQEANKQAEKVKQAAYNKRAKAEAEIVQIEEIEKQNENFINKISGLFQ